MTATYHERPRTGAEALQDLQSQCQTLLLGWLAYRAGRNHFNVHGDLEEAFIYGAHALRRWWVWIIFVKIWLFWLCLVGWLSWLEYHDIRGESFYDSSGTLAGLRWMGYIGLPITFVLCIAVPYCRNVDYSLFKRRLFYWIFRPLTILLDRVPNGALYLTVLVGLFFPVGWFTHEKTYDPRADHLAAVTEVCDIIRESVAKGETSAQIDPDLATDAWVGHDANEWYRSECG